MAEYTPSDEDVREGYALAPFEEELPDYGDEFLGQTADDRCAAWSRWLAAHDARVRRDAARRALSDLASEMDTVRNNPAPWVRRYRDAHYPETEDQT